MNAGLRNKKPAKPAGSVENYRLNLAKGKNRHV
jgi:hypothetical protein